MYPTHYLNRKQMNRKSINSEDIIVLTPIKQE